MPEIETNDEDRLRLIDAWVNPNQGGPNAPSLADHLFPGLGERRARGTTLSQLIDEMDEAGVEKAVLCASYANYDSRPWLDEALSKYPERFVGSIVVDPREGMAAVRKVDEAVRSGAAKLVRMLALYVQLPYNDSVYFPVYTKCAELGIPVGVNVGMPGPKVPGKHQHPMSLDDVCAFFPELTIVMSHGGDPWGALCAKLMQRWDNLHYMSSAYSPKRLPQEIIDWMNWRGSDRVMWASDYPVLEFGRCRQEILQMPFKDEERRRNFAYRNADRMFFSGGQAST